MYVVFAERFVKPTGGLDSLFGIGEVGFPLLKLTWGMTGISLTEINMGEVVGYHTFSEISALCWAEPWPVPPWECYFASLFHSPSDFSMHHART